MSQEAVTSPRPHVALVLAGGGARGAYEVGVAQYLFEDLAKRLDRQLPVDIFCGTSVGAINACALAASARDLPRGARGLARSWGTLRVGDVVMPSGREIFAMFRALLGRQTSPESTPHGGGLLDPAGLKKVVSSAIAFEDIEDHVASGRVRAVTVSATHIASGKTVVFVQRKEATAPSWGSAATVVPHHVRLRAPHALASAAIPLMFPAVRVEGELYCDGGLRQNVPLSPARRLGADGLLVINPRHIEKKLPEKKEAAAREEAFMAGPFFILGKALNALMLDRIDNDLDRLNRITAILDAGRRRFGEKFVAELNQELGYAPGQGVRPLATVLIRSSENIGKLAAEYVQSELFQRRNPGLMGRLIRRMADSDAEGESDLLSYLLFDGEFAQRLMELGRGDARAREGDLLSFASSLFSAQKERFHEAPVV